MKNTNKVIVIAEAGVNHNGSIKKALKMIDVAAQSGADFVKFQTFDPFALSNTSLGLANYQKKFLSKKKTRHIDMLIKLKLDCNDFEKIVKKCKRKKIKFLSSPFDIKSIKLLNKLKSSHIKVPSGQITDIPYLEFLGKLNKKIFLSTGASNIYEVKKAINILIKNGTSKNNIELLHCLSQYPASYNNLNLDSIRYIKDKLNFNVGFSDHSINLDASLLAIGLGARVIEKHFTLNKKLKGPDHQFSLNPKELKIFIKRIRSAEKSLGTYSKKPSKVELNNIKFMRKRIVAIKEINFGDVFSSENISTKRSINGKPASSWEEIIGKKSKRIYRIGSGI